MSKNFLSDIEQWFATSIFGSYIRHFVTIVFSLAVADFARTGAFDFANWQTWLIAGLVAIAPPLFRKGNKFDTLIQ